MAFGGARATWRRLTRRTSGGQAVTEFAFVVPLLLVLLLAIADFGRVFQAAIVMQSAARAAAEAAAVEYLRTEEDRATVADPTAYFENIHEVASRVACQEARVLPNTTYVDAADPTCPTWPAIAVCVHDDDAAIVDPACGQPAPGFTGGPAECSTVNDATTWAATEDPQGHDYVEVRVCYLFTTLFNLRIELPMGAGINVGEIYLQNKGAFVVADY